MSSHFSFDDLDSYIDEQIDIRESVTEQFDQYGGAVAYSLSNNQTFAEICRDYGIDGDDIYLRM